MKEGGRAERRFDIRIDAANFAVYAALKSNNVQGALCHPSMLWRRRR
jgi:hypothetical protein